AFPAALPGGFCGVDIFFVISGYLIGSHLIEAAGAGGLSFASFYGARARRLFPALVVVLASVWGAGLLVMTGPELAALGRHLLASALFSNNMLLATESGYFDAPAATKPLLHLWSLGVEEQFYLLVPLLIWLACRRAMRPTAWVRWLGMASLLWLVWSLESTQATSFYFLSTRFWELAAGVCLAERGRWAARPHEGGRAAVSGADRLGPILLMAITALKLADLQWDADRAVLARGGGLLLLFLLAAGALYTGRPDPRGEGRRQPSKQWQLPLGLALLVGSVAWLPGADWPGPQTIFPVIGTLLVLAGGASGLGARVLGSRVPVFVGGISYPLYLWHWPALVVLRLIDPAPSWGAIFLVLLVVAVLSWATKTLVENPIRHARFGRRRIPRLALTPVVGALATMGAIGWITMLSDGLPQRFSDKVRSMADWSEPGAFRKWRLGTCYQYLNTTAEFPPLCSPQKQPQVPTVLLWGDSHAGHLYIGLDEVARRDRFQLAQWTSASCPPTLRATRNEEPACAAKRARDWRRLETYVPDVVVLSAAWSLFRRSGNSPAELSQHLSETVAALYGRGVRKVLVFGPGPVWDASLPADLFRHMVRTHSNVVPARFGHIGEDDWELDARLAATAASAGAIYFSVLQTLCTRSGCLTMADLQKPRPDLLYWDRHHLTPSGSRLLVGSATASLRQAIGEAAVTKPGSPLP
ncbi:MAG: acyltransferase family protein, partial [Ramlibacter sp.]